MSDSAVERSARAALYDAGVPLDNVRFHRIPTDWCWCRDNGPMFGLDDEGLFIIDWRFTGWTGESPYEADDAVPKRVAEALGMRIVSHDMVVEGGALEFNGAGTVIVSGRCLRDRNDTMSDEKIEKTLKSALGVESVVWLEECENDDIAMGHPDSIARFADANTVIVGEVTNRDDPECYVYDDAAQRIITARHKVRRMPIPGRIRFRQEPFLANYMNWYIANGVVLVGTFGHREWDEAALSFVADLSAEFWGGRRVAGIDVRELWADGGGVHCVTQQQPLVT